MNGALYSTGGRSAVGARNGPFAFKVEDTVDEGSGMLMLGRAVLGAAMVADFVEDRSDL